MGPLIREREISSAGTQVPNDSLTLCSPVSSCYFFLPTSSEPISRLKIRIQRLGSSGMCLPRIEHDLREWAEIPAHLGAIFASQSCPAWGYTTTPGTAPACATSVLSSPRHPKQRSWSCGCFPPAHQPWEGRRQTQGRQAS